MQLPSTSWFWCISQSMLWDIHICYQQNRLSLTQYSAYAFHYYHHPCTNQGLVLLTLTSISSHARLPGTEHSFDIPGKWCLSVWIGCKFGSPKPVWSRNFSENAFKLFLVRQAFSVFWILSAFLPLHSEVSFTSCSSIYQVELPANSCSSEHSWRFDLHWAMDSQECWVNNVRKPLASQNSDLTCSTLRWCCKHFSQWGIQQVWKTTSTWATRIWHKAVWHYHPELGGSNRMQNSQLWNLPGRWALLLTGFDDKNCTCWICRNGSPHSIQFEKYFPTTSDSTISLQFLKTQLSWNVVICQLFKPSRVWDSCQNCSVFYSVWIHFWNNEVTCRWESLWPQHGRADTAWVPVHFWQLFFLLGVPGSVALTFQIKPQQLSEQDATVYFSICWSHHKYTDQRSIEEKQNTGFTRFQCGRHLEVQAQHLKNFQSVCGKQKSDFSFTPEITNFKKNKIGSMKSKTTVKLQSFSKCKMAQTYNACINKDNCKKNIQNEVSSNKVEHEMVGTLRFQTQVDKLPSHTQTDPVQLWPAQFQGYNTMMKSKLGKSKQMSHVLVLISSFSKFPALSIPFPSLYWIPKHKPNLTFKIQHTWSTAYRQGTVDPVILKLTYTTLTRLFPLPQQREERQVQSWQIKANLCNSSIKPTIFITKTQLNTASQPRHSKKVQRQPR